MPAQRSVKKSANGLKNNIAFTKTLRYGAFGFFTFIKMTLVHFEKFYTQAIHPFKDPIEKILFSLKKCLTSCKRYSIFYAGVSLNFWIFHS